MINEKLKRITLEKLTQHKREQNIPGMKREISAARAFGATWTEIGKAMGHSTGGYAWQLYHGLRHKS